MGCSVDFLFRRGRLRELFSHSLIRSWATYWFICGERMIWINEHSHVLNLFCIAVHNFAQFSCEISCPSARQWSCPRYKAPLPLMTSLIFPNRSFARRCRNIQSLTKFFCWADSICPHLNPIFVCIINFRPFIHFDLS